MLYRGFENSAATVVLEVVWEQTACAVMCAADVVCGLCLVTDVCFGLVQLSAG